MTFVCGISCLYASLFMTSIQKLVTLRHENVNTYLIENIYVGKSFFSSFFCIKTITNILNGIKLSMF